MSSKETVINIQGIREFDLSRIQLGNCLVVIGQRGLGKSVLNRDICHHFQRIPAGLIINGSESASAFYSRFFPSLFIYEHFDEEKLDNIFKYQSKILNEEAKKRNLEPADCKRIGNAFLYLMDDCMAEAKKWKNSMLVKKLFQQSRHFNLLSIVNLQYAMGLLPEQRSNVDFVFLFREDEVASKEKLYKQYAGIIPDQMHFNALMDFYCRSHGCLVIDKRSNSPNWVDRVFWYRAKLHPEKFRMGSASLWKLHDDRHKADDEQDEDPNVRRLQDTIHRYSSPGSGGKRVQIVYPHRKRTT